MKLRVLLPLGQLILAATLLTVGQHLDFPDKYEPRPLHMPTRVCFALNAPALFASWPIAWVSVALHIRKATSAILSPIDEIPFLGMVTVLWYLVARRLESFRNGIKSGAIGTLRSAGEIVENVLFLSIGLIQLYGTFLVFRYFDLYIHSISDAILRILILLWGIVLCFFSAPALFHLLYRSTINGSNQNHEKTNT